MYLPCIYWHARRELLACQARVIADDLGLLFCDAIRTINNSLLFVVYYLV